MTLRRFDSDNFRFLSTRADFYTVNEMNALLSQTLMDVWEPYVWINKESLLTKVQT